MAQLILMLTVIYAQCRHKVHYAECHYAECRHASSVMVSVVASFKILIPEVFRARFSNL